MIKIANIRELSTDKENQWAIVRSLKSKSPWMVQVSELSPSTGLFYRYLQLRDRGEWNMRTFRDVYIPWFIKDMKEYGGPMLNRLYLMDKQGIDVTCACFCPDESMCHRILVGGLLMGAGCNVTSTKSGIALIKEYTGLFELFKVA